MDIAYCAVKHDDVQAPMSWLSSFMKLVFTVRAPGLRTRTATVAESESIELPLGKACNITLPDVKFAPAVNGTDTVVWCDGRRGTGVVDGCTHCVAAALSHDAVKT